MTHLTHSTLAESAPAPGSTTGIAVGFQSPTALYIAPTPPVGKPVGPDATPEAVKPTPTRDPGKPLTLAEIEVLRSSRVAEAAEQLGMTEAQVRLERKILGLRGIRTKAWRPEELALLGTMTDEELAAHLNRSRSAVSKRRLALDRRKRAALRTRPWTSEEIDLLGTMPDRDLADQTGRTVPQVVFMRRARRIPMYQAPAGNTPDANAQ